MPLLPVALYGLEVPCDGSPVPAAPEFPATFRITMAAIDPDETSSVKVNDKSVQPRATLKIIREHDDHESDSDEDMRNLLSQSDSEDDEDSSDEDKNGGPSDLTKSKKARKAAAVKQLVEAITGDESDEEMGDAPNGEKADKKGKAKATEEDDDESEQSLDDECEVEEFIVCTLDPKKNYQQPLDITVGENERVYFKVTGTHTIYLTGNYLIADDMGLNRNFGEDEDDDEDYDLSPDEDELELGSDDEIDELDDLENPRITEIDSDDEKAPKLVKTSDSKPGKNKRSADEINDDNSLEGIMAKSIKADAAEEVKLSKKQLKKLKKNNGQATVVKTDEAKKDDSKSEKNDRKVQFAKNLEQGPSGSSEKNKADQSGHQKTTLSIKNVDGVKIDDKKIGSGRTCKKGDKVSMRYIGKLANGSVFDSNKKGTPFSFKLGTGEVIRGWDIGVVGMSPGGERRITIPPNKGYGNKAMPGIPANSTLIFDIKLLEVK